MLADGDGQRVYRGTVYAGQLLLERWQFQKGVTQPGQIPGACRFQRDPRQYPFNIADLFEDGMQRFEVESIFYGADGGLSGQQFIYIA